MNELNPLIQEMINKPLAFAGGFVSGLLRLNPETDPFATYLCKDASGETSTENKGDRTNGSGPQTIDIE